MSSLNNLLNPESSYESSLRYATPHHTGLLAVSHPPPSASIVRLQTVRSPTSSATSPTDKPIATIHTVEIKPPPPPPPPRAEVFIRAHEPHPDCPDTLACLPDTDGRPQHTLPVILRCTILGSPRKRLTIREIYAAMERKYPYYKTAGPAWKVNTLPLFARAPSAQEVAKPHFCSNLCGTISPSIACSSANPVRPLILASGRIGL
ncbi:hypothetical protein TRAPUB_605 [Trametes pubescens]|uniref:Fork-head domain-containing protein n=1 Tax=Trametes pubescens TaxID=154538 RepID=A0A1M2VLL3_TRAPU|nr:hypothetical protein TRAPUB_605 [Trametes pubescens]